MKIHTLIISGALVAGFALGGVGCAKSPEDVCGHVEKLMAKETSAEIAKKANQGCVKRLENKKEMKGYFKYRKFSRCAVEAKSLKDLKGCE